jgi:hypothetical protein
MLIFTHGNVLTEKSNEGKWRTKHCFHLSASNKIWSFNSGSLDNINKESDESSEFTVSSVTRATSSVSSIRIMDNSDVGAWSLKDGYSLNITPDTYVYAKPSGSNDYSWYRGDALQVGYRCYTQGRHEGEDNVIRHITSSVEWPLETHPVYGEVCPHWLNVTGCDSGSNNVTKLKSCFVRENNTGPNFLIRSY